MKPEVSIIIPAYNQAEYLSEALNSICCQTFSNWECIIVSDGSPDNVGSIAISYCQRDERFVFLDTENGGPSAARNFGIAKAKGCFILPLDADDKISSNYVEECLKAISASPNIKLVYGAGEKFGLINEPWKTKDYSWKKLLLEGNMIHCCGMYRKKDWLATGGYDVSMRAGLEDWEFWITLLNKDAVVIKLDTITFYWRIKEASRTTNLKKANRIALLNRYVFCKHAALYEEYFIDPLKLYADYNLAKNIADYALAKPFRFFLSRLFKKNLLRK